MCRDGGHLGGRWAYARGVFPPRTGLLRVRARLSRSTRFCPRCGAPSRRPTTAVALLVTVTLVGLDPDPHPARTQTATGH